ncbi:MAG: DUF1905 domain-containing protein [Chitinophagales bacterium]|nr:DUF1905 domain-containing protein [Chitinophagales bacterium]
MSEKFQSKIDQFDGDLWGFHFKVEKSIAEKLIDGKNRRVVCTINNSHSYQCGLMPYGDGDYFINVNKTIRTKLNLSEGSKVDIVLEKDESKYGLPMPEEFEEVLNQDKKANKYFHELTPGKQRTLLYIASNPKNTDKRIRKAFIIAEHLKFNSGKIDYRQLNSELKQKL